MSLNPSTVLTLFRAELRMVLRDRRVLITAILLPLLVTPLMFLGSSKVVKKREQKLRENVCRYAISGSEAARVRALLTATRERLDQVGVGQASRLPSGRPALGTTNTSDLPAKASGTPAPIPEQSRGKSGFTFKEVQCTNPAAALANGDLELILEGLPGGEARQAMSQSAAAPAKNGPRAARPAIAAFERRRVLGSQQPPTRNDAQTDSTLLLRTNALRAEAGSRSGETAKLRPQTVVKPLAHAVKKSEYDDDGEPPAPGTTIVRIIYRGDHDFSTAGMSRMSDALQATREERRAALLADRGFPLPPSSVAIVRETDLASKGHVAGLALGRAITLLLLLFTLTGGAVVATDSLAGEKERGTLETLLTTSARRVEIITAKHLLILAIALLITLIQSANLFLYVGLKLMPMPANMGAAVPPSVVIVLFFLYLPVLALAASVLLLVSGYAKTYKEAQMYFFPVFLVGLLPALTPFVPDLSLRSAIILVPVANIALAAKGILTGSADWPMIACAWLITAGAAIWTTSVSVRSLSAEKLITAAETDAVDFAGGPALFSRHVLRWFAVMWAALLIVNNYLEKADLRWQLIVNLVVLFFGASCLMLRRYQLNPRAALALRAPKPAVWLAVLVAVPSGLLTASGLFRLANLFVPISAKMMREFDQAVIPDNISAVQLLFFLCVMPAIFEEITFRGLLLHGLSRRLHPAALALVVGVVFGLFHVALFRFAPTACLGVLLAAVTLLTGSIFPAMLWHGLSNASGLLAYKLQIPLEELDPLSYLLGTAILVASFWIIWRNRTPYPGLRPWKG